MLLKEGDIIKIEDGMKVYSDIPKHFAYSNCKGSLELTEHLVEVGKDWEGWLSGDYIVVKTTLEGGGTGHGPHDTYPDGHKVYCEKVENKEIKCNFYQTGCFTAMLPDIKPIGKAKQTWEIEGK